MPFLADRPPRDSALCVEVRCAAVFGQVRAEMPADLHEAVNDLQGIVEDRRQLNQQRRFHQFLHLWLFCHVPLSYALIILSTAHAIAALRYSTLGS